MSQPGLALTEELDIRKNKTLGKFACMQIGVTTHEEIIAVGDQHGALVGFSVDDKGLLQQDFHLKHFTSKNAFSLELNLFWGLLLCLSDGRFSAYDWVSLDR